MNQPVKWKERVRTRIMLVPGFAEPPWLLLPIQVALRKHADRVDIWRDRWICRDIDLSIERFRAFVASCEEHDERLSIVTHSFGDWIVRQALQNTPGNHVNALVSIAPVMARCPVGIALKCLGVSFVSEVPVMADAARAAANAVVKMSGTPVRRLVIWGSGDFWVRPFELAKSENQTVERVFATHLSIVVQPNVLRYISQFLEASSGPSLERHAAGVIKN